MFGFIKYKSIVIYFLLSFSLCSKGQPEMSSNDTSFIVSMALQNEDGISLSIKYKDLQMNPENSFDNKVTRRFVAISVCCLAGATFMSAIILRYLCNVPLAKHSILLFLYKDIAISSLVICYINSLSLIDCFVNGNGDSLTTSHAIVISYCFVQLCLYLLCKLNVIILMKIYALKENVLDPSMPWEIDDEMLIKIWRASYFVIMNVFMMANYLCNNYPTLYYVLIADPRKVSMHPVESKLFPLLFLFLCISNIIFGIISKIYKNQEIRTFMYSGLRSIEQ